jgi:hypothetical protein
MVDTTSTRTLRRGTFSRGTVHCPKCAAAIHVFKVAELTDEFSLTCHPCGRRSFHARRDMNVEQFFDRRAKPRVA